MSKGINHNIEKTALVMDDDESIANAIQDAFKAFAEGHILSECVPKIAHRYKIDVECATNAKFISDRLRNFSKYDVFIIDKRFVDKDHTIEILSALQDLHVNSLRIVYTAYGNELDMKECMRLGAWDYIDKGQDSKATILDVVNSTILGLYEQSKSTSKRKLDIEAHKYIKEHAKEIVQQYRGEFLAFKQTKPETNTWQCIANNDSLFGLYTKLSSINVDRDLLHITHIDGIGEDEDDPEI